MDTAWKEYRLRKSIFWISIPIFFIWMWFCSSHAGILLTGFISGVAFVGASAIFYARWKCPRCHNSFVSKGAYGNILTTQCLHCGLSSYATAEEIKETEYTLKA